MGSESGDLFLAPLGASHGAASLSTLRKDERGLLQPHQRVSGHYGMVTALAVHPKRYAARGSPVCLCACVCVCVQVCAAHHLRLWHNCTCRMPKHLP